MNDYKKKKLKEVSERSKGDKAHAVTKGVLSAVPGLGGPAAELFTYLIGPPIAQRRDEWMQSVADGLKELEDQVEGFSIDSLKDKESFITTVLHASQLAIRNHQEEKREALRNAVLNVALENSPDDDLQQMFLNFIDTLTAWHLRILRFLQDPRKYGEEKGIQYPNWTMGGIETVIEATFQELKGRRDFYDQIGKDLYSRGLTNTESFHTTMSGHGLFQKRTSGWGERFLEFITSPIDH